MENTDAPIVHIGDKIRIISMEDPYNPKGSYNGREGTVTYIDDAGGIWGTWGSLALIPEIDKFEIL